MFGGFGFGGPGPGGFGPGPGPGGPAPGFGPGGPGFGPGPGGPPPGGPGFGRGFGRGFGPFASFRAVTRSHYGVADSATPESEQRAPDALPSPPRNPLAWILDFFRTLPGNSDL